MENDTSAIKIIEEVIKHTTKHEVLFDHDHEIKDDTEIVADSSKTKKPIDANRVEEAVEKIEQNYDNVKVMAETGQTTTEEEALSKKHLPTKHDQKTHAAKAAGYAGALSGLGTKEEAAKWADKSENEIGEALNSIEGLSREKRSRLTDSLRKIGNLKKTILSGAGKLSDFDKERLSGIARQIESDMEYVVNPETKHLPMRHDQKQHAGEVAASTKIASTSGGLTSAQHVELGNRLKRLSAVEGLPNSLKKRILAARATLKGIDSTKKMSPVEKKAYARAIREAKVSALAASKYMKGKKKFEGKPKPVVQKPATKPIQKKPVQPGQATPVQGQAKMTGAQVAQQAAAVQAKKGPLTFREKAISWLDGVVNKTGDSIKAFNAWNQGVLTSTFKQIKDKQAMSKKYRTWKNWQTSANSYRSALQREIVRSRGSNVPTRAFYELSRKYLDTQGTADKARGQFETFVGFDSEQLLAAMNKSTVGEPVLKNLNAQIEILESPYV